MSNAAEHYFSPLVSPRNLQRLDLADVVDLALRKLRSGGLRAERSALEPGGVVGGATAEATMMGTVFQDSFIVSPRPYGYLASVTGPGNLCREWEVASLDAAISKILADYDARKLGT